MEIFDNYDMDMNYSCN